jgi:hypothetical protein
MSDPRQNLPVVGVDKINIWTAENLLFAHAKGCGHRLRDVLANATAIEDHHNIRDLVSKQAMPTLPLA